MMEGNHLIICGPFSDDGRTLKMLAGSFRLHIQNVQLHCLRSEALGTVIYASEPTLEESTLHTQEYSSINVYITYSVQSGFVHFLL